MGAMTLVLDQRGTKVNLTRAHVLCLTYPDGSQHRVGLDALRRIVIQGDISLSSALLRSCQNSGVGIILLPGRRRRGESIQLLPNIMTHTRLRLAQSRAYLDKHQRLSLARTIVVTKIANQSLWLNRHDLNGDFAQAELQTQQAPDHATLMGIEGSTTRQYFARWRTLWDIAWAFQDRNRQPPRDPVNALLSLSYTIAGHQLEQAVNKYGLDLSLGFLHVPSNNRPALALDLLEPVRPWIDHWLWEQVQKKILLTPQHFFSNEQNGCRLNKEGRARFYAAWYDQAEPWLQAPMRQSMALILGKLRNR